MNDWTAALGNEIIALMNRRSIQLAQLAEMMRGLGPTSTYSFVADGTNCNMFVMNLDEFMALAVGDMEAVLVESSQLDDVYLHVKAKLIGDLGVNVIWVENTKRLPRLAIKTFKTVLEAGK